MISNTIVLSCPTIGHGRWKRITSKARVLGMKISRHVGASRFSESVINSNELEGLYNISDKAVALSHFRIWQDIAKQNTWCCVLEDDAILSDSLPSLLHDFEADPFDIDNIGFISLFPDGIVNSVIYNEHFGEVVTKPNNMNHGLVGYLISPVFAKLLIYNFNKISKPVDHYVYETVSDYKILYTHNKYVRHDNTKCSLKLIASR